MPKTYQNFGVKFIYPDNWTLEEDDRESDGFSVHVQSPATAFFLLSLHNGEPDPERLLNEALTTLETTYKQIEKDDVQVSLAGSPALGKDVSFTSLDFNNTCLIRSLAVQDGSLLILCQYTDAEEAINGRVLQAMMLSLQIED